MRKPRVSKATTAETAPPEPPATYRCALRDREFEAVLGARIRSARLAVEMSQTTLGEVAGISFQQVQKHENGKDRVAAGTLRALAGALGIDPGSFFADEAPVPSGTVAEIRESRRIGSRVLAIEDPVVVRRVLALADALAGGEGSDRKLARDDPGTAD